MAQRWHEKDGVCVISRQYTKTITLLPTFRAASRALFPLSDHELPVGHCYLFNLGQDGTECEESSLHSAILNHHTLSETYPDFQQLVSLTAKPTYLGTREQAMVTRPAQSKTDSTGQSSPSWG